MTSSIDATKPIQGRPTTASVRANFAAAKGEIEALQDKTSGVVSAFQYGAVGDGTTDDTAAIQAAIDAMYAAGGGIVDCTGGRWLIDSANLTVKQGVTLVGPWHNFGEATSFNFESFKSCFIVNETYTINLAQKFSGIKGLGIFRKGLATPTSAAECDTQLAQFAGVAVTVGDLATSNIASDTYFGYCLVLGFEYAYKNDYNERPRVEYVNGDCTNGIWMSRVYDMNHLNNCHFWPFWVAHAPFGSATSSGWQRTGVAYYLDRVDWGQADQCFSYGYQTGFQIEDCDHSTFINCGADDNGTLFTRLCYGFHVSGAAYAVNFIGCKAAAKTVGYYLNSTQAAGDVAIVGGSVWGISNAEGGVGPTGILVNDGTALIHGVQFFTVTKAIETMTNAVRVSVDGCLFSTVTTPFTLNNAGRVAIGSNNLFISATSGSRPTRMFDNQPSGEVNYSWASNGGSYNSIHYGARGSTASPAISVNGDKIGGHEYWAYDGTQYLFAAGVRYTATDPSAGVMSGRVIWNTNNAGTTADRLALNADGTLVPVTDSTYSLGTTSVRWLNIHTDNITISPGSSVTPANNGEVTFQLTSNTELTFRVKGSDGNVRSGTVTLS